MDEGNRKGKGDEGGVGERWAGKRERMEKRER